MFGNRGVARSATSCSAAAAPARSRASIRGSDAWPRARVQHVRWWRAGAGRVGGTCYAAADTAGASVAAPRSYSRGVHEPRRLCGLSAGPDVDAQAIADAQVHATSVSRGHSDGGQVAGKTQPTHGEVGNMYRKHIRGAKRGVSLPSSGCPSRYTASILTHPPDYVFPAPGSFRFG